MSTTEYLVLGTVYITDDHDRNIGTPSTVLVTWSRVESTSSVSWCVIFIGNRETAPFFHVNHFNFEFDSRHLFDV